MKLTDAMERVKQIFEEERSSPTVQYVIRQSHGVVTKVESVTASQELQATRSLGKARQILEIPHRFVFESVNYSLLRAILVQVPEHQRATFVRSLVLLTKVAPACGQRVGQIEFPSELPLVMEFAVRNAGKDDFFSVLAEATPFPGHVGLLRHLQDMIALDYTLFSEGEYDRLDFAVAQLGQKAQAKMAIRSPIPVVFFPGIGQVHPSRYCHEIGQSACMIKELCRKAKYIYLKGALLEGLNLEVNQDRDAVVSHLEELGFGDTLIQSLNEADRLYHGPATAFELKSGMGHLRSFVENLHAEAISTIVAKGVAAPAQGWGSGLAFLRQNGVLTLKEEQLAASLYGLISDEAVHPLIAEREYARLARNMVIEYALLFLRKMDKLGLKRP